MEDLSQDVRERYQGDNFPRSLGIEILELGPGYAKVGFTVRPDMVNFHEIAHGGAIFTLADTAFGLASNTRGPAVALTVNINYLAPAKPGAYLTATAREEHLTKRTGIYAITVADAQGQAIAIARGTVYRKRKGS